MGFEFVAEPKLINNKKKYRSQMMDPTIQERNYILQMQENNKKKNLEKQINLFKKKHYETPYDIKSIIKEKIPINLDFFLIENKENKIIKNNLSTQTDKIKDLNNPDILNTKRKKFLKKFSYINKNDPIGQNDFIPKKTGIDAFTQVEHDELFDFDLEVAPIISIIITKTIEQSLLELEEETEIENMKKFKENYFQKKINKDDKENKKIIENEKLKIKNKNDLLENLTIRKKKQEETEEKILINNISWNFLKNIIPNSIKNLKNKNYYKINILDIVNENLTDFLMNKVEIKIDNNINIFKKVNLLIPEYKNDLLNLNKNYMKYIHNEKNKSDVINFVNNKNIDNDIYMKIEVNNYLNNYFIYHIEKIANNELKKFEENFIINYKEINEKIINDEIKNEDLKTNINEILPNYELNNLMNINQFKKIKICFSNNPKRKIKNKIFDLSLCFYNENNDFYDYFDNENTNINGIKIIKSEFNMKFNENYENIYFIDLEKLKNNDFNNFLLFINTNENCDFKDIDISLYQPTIKIFNDNGDKLIYNKILNVNDLINNETIKQYINDEENLIFSFYNLIANKENDNEEKIIDSEKIENKNLNDEESENDEIENNIKNNQNLNENNETDQINLIKIKIDNEKNILRGNFLLMKMDLNKMNIIFSNTVLVCNRLLNMYNILGDLLKKYNFDFNFKSLGERLSNEEETNYDNNYNKIIGPLKLIDLDYLKEFIQNEFDGNFEYELYIRNINISDIPNYKKYFKKYKNINSFNLKVEIIKEKIENLKNITIENEENEILDE